MPGIVRALTDSDLGHGGTYSPITKPSSTAIKTKINGQSPVRIGDSYPDHTLTIVLHSGRSASGGSSKVKIEGSFVHRATDSISCGDTAATGSDDVIVNS